MKVLLLQNVARVGNKDDIVEVSEGYARNFLIKKGFAREVGAGVEKDILQKKQIKERQKSEELQKEIDFVLQHKEKALVLKLKANDQGHLFEKIDKKKLAILLSERSGAKFSEKDINFEAPIKSLGEYEINIKLAGKSFKFLLELQAI